MALCGFCGLRSHEAVGVKREHFDPVNRRLMVVAGKGAKDRVVPVSGLAMTYLLMQWLETQPGDYLVSKESGRQITPGGAQSIIRRLGSRAGISDVSSHRLRATFATEVYNATLDVLGVQSLLGHSSVVTTQGYVGRSVEELEAVVNAWSSS